MPAHEMVWNSTVKKVNVIGGFTNISSGVEKRSILSLLRFTPRKTGAPDLSLSFFVYFLSLWTAFFITVRGKCPYKKRVPGGLKLGEGLLQAWENSNSTAQLGG